MKKTLAYISIIAAIIVLHVAYFIINHSRGSYSLGVDGDRYKSLATAYLESKSILGEQCKTLFWTPWFVYIAMLGANPIAVFLFNLTCFGFVLFFLFKLADFVNFPPIAKIVLLLVYGLYWPTFDHCLFYHYEMFLSFIFAAAIFWLSWKYNKMAKSTVQWVYYGLICGLGMFAHPKALGAFLLGVYSLFKEKKETGKILLKLSLLAFLSFIFIFMWGVRNKIVTGQWVFTSTSFGYNLYVGFNPIAEGTFSPQPPYPPQDNALNMALDYIRTHPHRSIYLVGIKIIKFWYISKAQAFGPPFLLLQEWIVLPLSLLGFLAAIYQLASRRMHTSLSGMDKRAAISLRNMVFLVIYFLIFHGIFYVCLPRFRLPMMPALCFFAVYFGVFVNDHIISRDIRRTIEINRQNP